MARLLVPISVILTLGFILSCASGGGGLRDPEEALLALSEINVEKTSWRKEAPFEIHAGKDVIGSLKRFSETGSEVDSAEVFSLDDQLLYTLRPVMADGEWQVSIIGSESRDGSIRSQKVPTGNTEAEVHFPSGMSYTMFSAYQFKGGADGYGHHQWIVAEADIPQAIFEAKVWNDRLTNEIFVAASLLGRRDEVLAWVGLGVLYAEMDAVDRYEEDEREAAEYLKRKTRSDSNSSWLF